MYPSSLAKDPCTCSKTCSRLSVTNCACNFNPTTMQRSRMEGCAWVICPRRLRICTLAAGCHQFQHAAWSQLSPGAALLCGAGACLALVELAELAQGAAVGAAVPHKLVQPGGGRSRAGRGGAGRGGQASRQPARKSARCWQGGRRGCAKSCSYCRRSCQCCCRCMAGRRAGGHPPTIQPDNSSPTLAPT